MYTNIICIGGEKKETTTQRTELLLPLPDRRLALRQLVWCGGG